MRNKSIITIVAAVIITFGLLAYKNSDINQVDIQINSANGAKHKFNVEIAASNKEKRKGLMNREFLAKNSGMLFIYHKPRDDLIFWMKNTLIPLDMIFIDRDGKIAKIHKNAQPMDEALIKAGNGVQNVLEINGGLSDKLGIAVGDTVQSML